MASAGAPHVAPVGARSSSPILTFVQDSGNDLLGHTTTTLTSLEVDPANLQTSQPAPICMLNNEFQDGAFNGIGMLGNNGRLALMFAPMIVRPSILGQLNHPDKGKFVGILGDLYQGSHHSYYIKMQNPCPFERISNAVPCLSAALIHTAAQTHTGANLLFTVGPHDLTDAGVMQRTPGRSSRSPSSSSNTF